MGSNPVAGSNYITNLEVAEQKLFQLQTRQKCLAKLLKEKKEEVCTLQKHCNNPVTIYEVIQACQEVFLHVTIVLESVPLKRSNQRKRIVVNESMNDLRSSVKIQVLDALMRLYNMMSSFSVTEVQDISIWLTLS